MRPRNCLGLRSLVADGTTPQRQAYPLASKGIPAAERLASVISTGIGCLSNRAECLGRQR